MLLGIGLEVAIIVISRNLEGTAKVVMDIVTIGYGWIYSGVVIYRYVGGEIKRKREIETKYPEQMINKKKYPFI